MNAKTYVTTYCNHPHSLTSGKPVGHDCFIIPPAALAAEREGDTEKAIELIEAGKTSFVFGVPSLPPCNSKGKEAK